MKCDAQGGMLSNWYALQVRTGHEEEMIEICRPLVEKIGGGGEVFTIYKKKEMHGGGGSRWIATYPLFPGYLFIQTDDIESVRRSLKLVVQFKRILKSGDQFMPLFEEEAQMFRALGGKDHIVEMSVGWKEGDRIGVLDGPLVLFSGRIKKVNKNKNKALIETKLLDRTVDIWVGLKFLATKTEAEQIVWRMRKNHLLLEEVMTNEEHPSEI